jgi:c-di-GMP-binding flagellar brake protein YcgR
VLQLIPMRRCLKGVVPLAIAVVLTLAAARPVSADTREERVRKFQNSLGEKVVRDSGNPLSPEKQSAFTLEAVLWISVLAAALFGLQRILSRIGEKRREAESSVRYLTENLMTPEAVLDHLDRIVRERIPLSVWIDDHFIKFSSHGDELERDGGGLVVLPLAPAVGNDMIRTAQRVRVEYMYQKVPYHFECRHQGERTDAGSFVHVLSVPDRIGFTQRREMYRVEPPLSAPLSCRITGSEQEEMSVLDIGVGGFSVATSVRLRAGEEIAAIRVAGGAMLPIEGSARCVYELALTESKARFRFRFGFEFTRLVEGSDRRLSLYISKQQVVDLSRRREMEG